LIDEGVFEINDQDKEVTFFLKDEIEEYDFLNS